MRATGRPARRPALLAPLRLALLRLALLLLAGRAPAAAADAEGWEAGRRSEGDGYAYQIFSQSVEGEAFVRYQARGHVEVPAAALPGSVRVTTADPARAPDRQTRRPILVEDGELVVYTHIDLPPLFSDRDIVTRGIFKHDAASGVHRVDWEAIEHAEAPPRDGVIRIARSAGFWQFTPDGEDRAEVVHETYVDLGGALPGWLVQPMMAGMVGDAFEQVAEHALGR